MSPKKRLSSFASLIVSCTHFSVIFPHFLIICTYNFISFFLSLSFSLFLSRWLSPLRKGDVEREEQMVAGRWRKAGEKSGVKSQRVIYVCVYIYLVHECPHANIDYERQRRKTNQLRESASIIAGVAVRNASRKPDVDGRWSGTGLIRTTRPLCPFLCSVFDFDFLNIVKIYAFLLP